MERKSTDLKKYLILIVFTLVGLWVINNLAIIGNIIKSFLNIIFPFILGGCLAYLLNIPMSFFERKCKKVKNKKLLRIISLSFAIVVILTIIMLVITLIVPRLIDIVKLLIDNIPYYSEQIGNFISGLEIDLPQYNIDIYALKDQIMNQIPNILTTSISVITNTVSAISNFIIAIIFAIYILIDKEKLQRQFNKIMKAYIGKRKRAKLINIGRVASKVFRKFFTVQCLEATILGSLCIIGMLILKIPYAISIGVLIGVTALIPIVGAFIGVIIGAILIVSVAPIKVITFIVYVLILQQIEGNLIYPRVVGSSVGLSGMWVLAAVTVGGSIGGILGMLIGVPIATTVYTLLRKDVNKKLETKSNKLYNIKDNVKPKFE